MVEPSNRFPIIVHASDKKLHTFVAELVVQMGLVIAHNYRPGTVHLIVDIPLLWAFAVLDDLPKRERAFAVVSTQATHPVYFDCLMSYRLSGVFFHTDAIGGMAALYAAAAGITSYAVASGLTPAEIRIVRLLLRGYDSKEIATRLHVTCSTINSHFSRILQKIGCSDRAQLVARVLGDCLYQKVQKRSNKSPDL